MVGKPLNGESLGDRPQAEASTHTLHRPEGDPPDHCVFLEWEAGAALVLGLDIKTPFGFAYTF